MSDYQFLDILTICFDFDTFSNFYLQSNMAFHHLQLNVRNPTLIFAPNMNHTYVSQVINAIVSEDNFEQITWLEKCLRDEMNDRDESNEEPENIPIVPTSEGCIAALEKPSFINFLKLLELVPPNHQEKFWRIPAHITFRGLKAKLKFIWNLRGDMYQKNRHERDRKKAKANLLKQEKRKAQKAKELKEKLKMKVKALESEKNHDQKLSLDDNTDEKYHKCKCCEKSFGSLIQHLKKMQEWKTKDCFKYYSDDDLKDLKINAKLKSKEKARIYQKEKKFYKKELYKINKEKHCEKMAEYYEKNRDKILLKKQLKYQEQKDEIQRRNT